VVPLAGRIMGDSEILGDLGFRLPVHARLEDFPVRLQQLVHRLMEEFQVAHVFLVVGGNVGRVRVLGGL
jgi:hypothetical protein